MTNQDKRMSGDYQRAVDQFVGKHVHQCASTLVSELQSVSLGVYEDDMADILYKSDWLEPALQHCDQLDREECTSELEAVDITVYEHETLGTLRDAVECSLNDATIDPQEFCDTYHLDPEDIEAYEHWVVSRDLSYWLEERGEMVTRDLFGMTIWGRCTTGQSISIDGVICDIFDDRFPNWEPKPCGHDIRLATERLKAAAGRRYFQVSEALAMRPGGAYTPEQRANAQAELEQIEKANAVLEAAGYPE